MGGTSTENDTVKVNFKTITVVATMTNISTPTTMLSIAATYASMLTMTNTNAITATIATTTTITQTAKETTIITDWISQDSVVVGITVACVALLLLITFMVTAFYFSKQNVTVKKGVPAVSS